MDEFHFAVIDLRPTIKHAAADILDFSLDKGAFRLVRSQAEKVAISEANLQSGCDKQLGRPAQLRLRDLGTTKSRA